MPRQFQPVEFNTFIGGLVTEASPLTFPNNASLDEENFVLNRDGSRSRRLGLAFEDQYQIITNSQSINNQGTIATGSYKWANAGGQATNTIICVQVGASIDFFLGTSNTISKNKIFSHTFSGLSTVQRFSFATVDGTLVVATGSKDITIFTFDTTKIDPTTAITVTTKRLLVRDLFGLDCFYSDGRNLREGTSISLRPLYGSVGPPHIYNLRNQGWAIPHSHWNGNDYVQDTIIQFSQYSQGRYPSNADNINQYLYANTNDSGGTKTITRFDAENLQVNPPANTYSPLGYFIIDALDRGTSRIAALYDMQDKYPQNDSGLLAQALRGAIEDSTPTGASVVCEFAGRVFYAGFSGEVIGGDTHSPKLNSYVLFSQLVQDSSGINLCYQDADPTDLNNSDLVDTDGGFLRIEGAYGICGMAVLQSTLFVLAQNGVWAVTGGTGNGFTATNYQVSKLTTSGCISTGSIVVMQDSIFYWSLDGIYSITRNQFGDFKSDNITDKTIKKFFMNISDQSVRNAEGVYDAYNTTVKWLYNNYVGAPDDTIELCLNCITGAYYRHRIKPISNGYPIVIRGIQTDPYRISISQNQIVVNSDTVVDSTGDLVVTDESTLIDSGVKDVSYFILTGESGGTQYTFGDYSEAFHYDWVDVDQVGIDAPAYLITGVLSGGDYQRNKQIVYQTTHFKQTEVLPIPTYYTSELYSQLYVEKAKFALTPGPITVHTQLQLYTMTEKATFVATPGDVTIRTIVKNYTQPPEKATFFMLPGPINVQTHTTPQVNMTATEKAMFQLAPGTITIKTVVVNYTQPSEKAAFSLVPGSVTITSTSSNQALLHLDGTNGSTTITDSKSAAVWTANGTAAISTAQSKFGGASCYFDGSSGYLSAPAINTFNTAGGDFTLEAWVYPTMLTSGNMVILSKDGTFGSSYSQYDMSINSAGKLVANIGSGNGTTSIQSFTGTTTITTNAWHHVAITRTGNMIRGFVDGNQEWATAQTATMIDGGKPLLIGYQTGQPASNRFNGYIDEVRTTIGKSWYTGNFTPPTTPFT